MGLKDMAGQPVAYRLLSNALSSGRIAHGYLFSGPPGAGKRWAARNFAKAINCETARVGSGAFEDACETCAACILIDKGTHPDVHWIEAEGDSLKIETLRAARLQAWTGPSVGRRRVIVLVGAEAMTPAAAACILKVLEEPPLSTIFILTTVEPALIMPTVTSRCQVVPFRRSDQTPLVRREHPPEAASESGEASASLASASEDAEQPVKSLAVELLELPRDGDPVSRRLRGLECGDRLLAAFSGRKAADALDGICLALRESLARGRLDREDLKRHLRTMEAMHFASRAIRRNANPRLAVAVAMLSAAGASGEGGLGGNAP